MRWVIYLLISSCEDEQYIYTIIWIRMRQSKQRCFPLPHTRSLATLHSKSFHPCIAQWNIVETLLFRRTWCLWIADEECTYLIYHYIIWMCGAVGCVCVVFITKKTNAATRLCYFNASSNSSSTYILLRTKSTCFIPIDVIPLSFPYLPTN